MQRGFSNSTRQIFAKDHPAGAGVKGMSQDVNHAPQQVVHGVRLGLRTIQSVKCLRFTLTDAEIGAIQRQVGRQAQLFARRLEPAGKDRIEQSGETVENLRNLRGRDVRLRQTAALPLHLLQKLGDRPQPGGAQPARSRAATRNRPWSNPRCRSSA